MSSSSSSSPSSSTGGTVPAPGRSAGRTRRPLATLFLTVFLDLLGFGMVIPILALYAKRFGVSDVAVTTMGASYSIMQLVFAPIWGRLSDRHGRRPILLVSIAGSSLSQLGYALAPSFVFMVVARCVAGTCGANIAAAQAYIADSTDEKGRAAGMGLLGMAMGLGFVLGPLFGGLLGRFGPTTPFFVASALSALNFVLASRFLPEPNERKKGTRELSLRGLATTVAEPGVRGLILLLLALTAGFANLEQTFPFYLARRFQYGHTQVGYIFGFLGLVMIVVQGVLVRRLAPRLGERPLVVFGTAVLALGMLLQFQAHGWALLLSGVALIAVGNGLYTPSLQSLISRSAGLDRQGSVLGVAQSASALGRIVGPISGGYFLRYGEATPMLVGATLVGLACLYAAATVKSRAAMTPAPSDAAA